jgi:hypothetical protein
MTLVPNAKLLPEFNAEPTAHSVYFFCYYFHFSWGAVLQLSISYPIRLIRGDLSGRHCLSPFCELKKPGKTPGLRSGVMATS